MPPLFQLNGLAFHDAKPSKNGIGANGRTYVWRAGLFGQ